MSIINVERLIAGKFRQIDADQLLSRFDQKEADRLRMKITRARKLKDAPIVRCGLCKEPVYIKANPLEDNLYHFSHFKTDDPVLKRCVQRTSNQSNLELIRALKYQGAQESSLHYRTKYLVAGLLTLDESIDSDTIKVESTLHMEGEWRKPDVQAIHDSRLIAFEVQVSTEMAPMIVAREHFYERFGNILWVLPNFSPENMNQSQRDILTTNQDHLFVLNKEMRRLSRDNSLLHLQAWIHWPVLSDGKIERVWMVQTVTLNDISFKGGHALVLDVEAEEHRIKADIEKIESQKLEEQHRQNLNWEDQTDFFGDMPSAEWGEWWGRWQAFTEELVAPWHQGLLRKELEQDIFRCGQSTTLTSLWLTMHDIQLPLCNCSQFVLRALLCASDGTLNYGYNSWKWVAKTLLKEHPYWFAPFYKILRINQLENIRHELNCDQQIKERLDRLRRSPLLLNSHQNRLLGLIEPKLNLKVPIYELEPYKMPGPHFLFKRNVRKNEKLHAILPEDLLTVTQYMLRLETSASVKYERNIIEALHFMVTKKLSIPFPNLPLRGNGIDYYYVEEKDIDLILPAWDEQLSAFERELARFAW